MKTEEKTAVKHVLIVDSMIFIGILGIALLGVGFTDYKGQLSEYYWRWVFIALAITTTVWGVWRSRKLGVYTESKILYRQAVIWGAGLLTMGVIFLLLSTGRLNYETTGLLILLLLALVTFIDGLIVSWKLYFVGVTFLMILLLSTYVESYLWMILIFAGVMMALVGIIVILEIKKLQNHI